MRFLNNGENLNKEELNEILNNFYVTKHARQRIYERKSSINEIKNIIKNPLLAYYNTDGSINIAKTRYEYIVFDWNEKYNTFSLITFKEKSHNDIDIYEKQKLAKNGIDRK